MFSASLFSGPRVSLPRLHHTLWVCWLLLPAFLPPAFVPSRSSPRFVPPSRRALSIRLVQRPRLWVAWPSSASPLSPVSPGFRVFSSGSLFPFTFARSISPHFCSALGCPFCVLPLPRGRHSRGSGFLPPPLLHPLSLSGFWRSLLSVFLVARLPPCSCLRLATQTHIKDKLNASLIVIYPA